ncbi:MAG: class I SAM-dependent rRNA methyltransferase [Thiomonas sp.]|uniref:class I SAM-dependent rRNA methyltransferase n=1 Tax=Thiomonas sp. TaxID=2047785 RepID=UPI002A365F20|nr:class I SAM-dependent rRNA methyltransferase [Thiomonas sp.]MDY0330008.1 class I SAM-dependent rRNA methyltransferase [Thiomonas sp.]
MKTIRLHPGKERSLLRRHPWVFASSIAKGAADSGETVRVESHDGQFLAWATFSPASQIRLRVWSFEAKQRIDASFFTEQLRAAIERRQSLGLDLGACRLVHGESDGLPGCIVDRYDDIVVLQAGSAGIERWKSVIADGLQSLMPGTRIYERSDAALREREGLPASCGWLRGGGATQVEIVENGLRLQVDVATGHKTGFYLDQRDARARFAKQVRMQGLQRVFNGFCYTGGFSLAALAGGAQQVVSVDSSAPALALAAEHVALNGFDPARASFIDADVNATLRRLRDEGAQFDAIVLDPPKFAASPQQVERAARAYKDINRLAFHLLPPGGWLFTFSCSGGVSAELFQKIVAGAALDAGADAQIVARTGAGLDHPLSLHFPEGEYLKGLLLRKA